MKPPKSILVHVTGEATSNAAVAKAAMIAERSDATLHLVDVFFELPQDWLKLANAMKVGDLRELATHDRHAELEKAAEPLRKKGHRVSTDVYWGRPYIEVIRDAMTHDHDIIVKAAGRGEGLDATEMRLMRKSPVPVWIVRADAHSDRHRILAAVDPTLFEPGTKTLDFEILGAAMWQAEMVGGVVHVVHAWQRFTERGISMPPNASREIRAFVDQTRDRHEKWLAELLAAAGLKLPDSQVHLVQGDPAETINRTAYEIGADLLVMGTVREQDVAGLFIGQTAEEVLSNLLIPVLALKPEGFATPVDPSGKRPDKRQTVDR